MSVNPAVVVLEAAKEHGYVFCTPQDWDQSTMRVWRETLYFATGVEHIARAIVNELRTSKRVFKAQ